MTLLKHGLRPSTQMTALGRKPGPLIIRQIELLDFFLPLDLAARMRSACESEALPGGSSIVEISAAYDKPMAQVFEDNSGLRIHARRVERENIHAVAQWVKGRVISDEHGNLAVGVDRYGSVPIGDWFIMNEDGPESGKFSTFGGSATDVEFQALFSRLRD